MAFVLIDVCRGLVGGVYTNALEPLNVKIYDSNDEYDAERASLFAACRYLAEHGGLRDCMCEDTPDSCPSPLARPADAAKLIAEDNWLPAEDGGTEQQLDAAFAAGYLAAVTELNSKLKSISHLDLSAHSLYILLQELMDEKMERFFDFCEELNRRGRKADGDE